MSMLHSGAMSKSLMNAAAEREVFNAQCLLNEFQDQLQNDGIRKNDLDPWSEPRSTCSPQKQTGCGDAPVSQGVDFLSHV